MNQDYHGNITIKPEFSFNYFSKILTNPSDEDFQFFIREGERATWPKIKMIENQTRISKKLDECYNRLKSMNEQ